MPPSPSSDQVGRVLGDRYRLLAPIGRGASAVVFLAHDVRLDRQVAVKVLHQALADDDGLLDRFRAEAQAAAGLGHPHVVAVHDWGHDRDAAWIVTEYLGGGSLRGLLDRGHRLTPSQALLVGLQAGQGLAHAHARGVVHRDVKPANLLFGDDGRLRVADFGLARALAEAALTEPTGTAVGTVRYASPEQAQGLPLAGPSDVYSLALVLVEAVTGEVPFARDTAWGTLAARVDRPLSVPASLGPLADVLAGAGLADPAERLDAAELVAALTATARRLPRPGALPLPGALDEDLDDDRDPTVLAPPRPADPTVADGGPTRVDGADGVAGPPPAPDADWRPDLRPAGGSAAAPPVGDDDGWDDDEWDDDDGDGWDDADEDEGWGDDGWDPRSPTGQRPRGGLGLAVALVVLAGAVTAVVLLVADLAA